MNRNKVISLADALECPAAVIVFHNRYWARLTGIKTVNQRNDALSDMQQDFEKEVREEPQIRNQLSEIYALLKQRVWECI